MENQFEDKEMECVEEDCTNEGSYIWPAGEQQFFHDKGLYMPRRCPECRAKKRRERAEAEQE